jgi:hypothetical protein
MNTPSPKYALSRYSTKQLLVWLEECELARCEAWDEYSHSLYGDDALPHYVRAARAAMRGNAILTLLKMRNCGAAALRAIEATAEDFRS